MAYVPSAVSARELSYPEASRTPEAPQTKPASRGLWRRLFNAMIASRQRQVDLEIERYLQNIGGKFTDGHEREIERRFLSKPSHLSK